MNGIISSVSIRSTLSMKEFTPTFINKVLGGVALLSGFVIGTQVHLPTFNVLTTGQSGNINYEKLSWISKVSEIKFETSKPIQLSAFHETKISEIRYTKKLRKASRRTLKKTIPVVQIETEADSDISFLHAYQQMKRAFFSGAIITPLTRSERLQYFGKEEFQVYATQETQLPKAKLLPPRPNKKMLSGKKKPDPKKTFIQAVSVALVTQSESKSQNIQQQQIRPEKMNVDKNVVTITKSSAEPTTEQNAVQITDQTNKIQNDIQSITTDLNIAPLEAAFVPKPGEGTVDPIVKNEIESKEIKSEIDDINNLQAAWKAALIEEQFKAIQIQKNRPLTAQLAAQVPTTVSAPMSREEKTIKSDQEDDQNESLVSDQSIIKKTSSIPSKCDILSNHNFVKPGATLDSQPCPADIEWISKEIINKSGDNRLNHGWVKLNASEGYAVMTRHPAPNQGATLLLEQNAIALLALKSGNPISRAAGIIVGVLPPDHQIEFQGRGEDPIEFEVQDRKYFAVLNAEPGAGVIDIYNKKNLQQRASIFAPVLPGTVTYLDLAAVQQVEIRVEVYKRRLQRDPEIAGLAVRVSTQPEIKAITNSYGFADLKNIYNVPGFPFYVDVASQNTIERSTINGSTYRYELKRPNRKGVYRLKQYPANQIAHYTNQHLAGISDQSSMLMGKISRKKLDGFKSYYTAQVESLTENFGLKTQSYSILHDDVISASDPLEGDLPRFMAVQMPEGISRIELKNEQNQVVYSSLIPVMPNFINVISE
jgi:hypothetical protein